MERWRLADLLERVGDGDEAAHQELLEYIMRQPEGIRVLAFEALQEGGEDTYDQLMLTLAHDPDLVIRSPSRRPPTVEGDFSHLPPMAQQAEQEWREMSGVGRQAPAELLARLSGTDRSARVQAARQLGQYADPAAIEALVGAIRAGDKQVGGAAVEALHQIGGAAVPTLVAAMGEGDEQLRWHVAKALSGIANEQATPALVGALDDRNYGTRWLAAEGLVHAGRAALVPLLRRLAEEKTSSWVRQGAWHVFNKANLSSEEERLHYKQLAVDLKRASAATIPDIARRELRRLGQDA